MISAVALKHPLTALQRERGWVTYGALESRPYTFRFRFV